MTIKDKIALRDMLRCYPDECRFIIDDVMISEWVEDEDRTPGTHYRCKTCGTQWGRAAIVMKYCPGCGYWMRNTSELFDFVKSV